MKQFTVDFTGIKTIWYFYEELIKGLEFPAWCGKNLDAIWDLVTGYLEYPAIITFKGIKTLPEDLKDEAKSIINIFNEAMEFYNDERFKIQVID